MSEGWDDKIALECANGDPRLAAFHKALCEIADENPSLSFRVYFAIDQAARSAFCTPATPPRAEVDVDSLTQIITGICSRNAWTYHDVRNALASALARATGGA